MIVDKKFYINAGGDGVLEDTNEDDLLGLISDLKNSEKLVIHLHGGVVSKASALATAARCLSGGTPAEDTMVDRRHRPNCSISPFRKAEFANPTCHPLCGSGVRLIDQ